jgi:iron complex transport system permease protein
MTSDDISKLHADKLARWTFFLVVLLVGLVVTIIVSLCIGSVGISPGTVFNILIGRTTALDDKTSYEIIMNVRLPRVLLAGVVGAGLAIAGTSMQGIFRNPMASPSILGISSGAAFGAALAIVLGLSFVQGEFAVPAMAFVFCIATMFLVYGVSRTGGYVPVETLLLAGVALGALFSALVSFLTYLSAEQIGSIVFWLMGGFWTASWSKFWLAFILCGAGAFFTLWFARDLNAMTIGEDHATALGIDTQRVMLIIIVLTSVIVAAAVAFAGVIGFVGLIVPHMMRILVGPDHRILMPVSILTGASFLIITDAFARTIMSPAELPVGIITAVLGAPFFLYLLRRRKHMMGW